MELTRRRMLVLSAAGAGGIATAVSGASDDEPSSLAGGTMALSEAYKVAPGVWIGPDSAKSEVSADAGNIYMASDTDVDYYGDGGAWTKRAIGSSSEPVPAVNSEQGSFGKVSTEEEGITEPVVRGWYSPNTYQDAKIADYTSIAQAINDIIATMPSSGGAVELPHGIFEVSGASINLDKSIRFVGQQASTVWDDQGTVLRLGNGEDRNILNVAAGVYEVDIQHIGFDGNKNNNSSGNLIDLDTAHDVWIDRVFLAEAAGDGLNAEDGHDVFFTRSQVENVDGRGVFFGSGITDTYIWGVYPFHGNAGSDVVYSGAGEKHHVSLSRFHAGGGIGVDAYLSSGNVKVNQCQFYEKTSEAIRAQDTPDVSAVQNTFEAGSGITPSGIEANGVEVAEMCNTYDGTFSNAPRVTVNGGSFVSPLSNKGHNPVRSAPPNNPSAGDWYIDDGTSTSSGNLALRVYDGSEWVDQN